MFTGIIQTQGVVKARGAGRLLIQPQRPLKGLSAGESVAVDGICLTVDRVVPTVPGAIRKKVPGTVQRLAFHLLPETVRVSTLGHLRIGDAVNLERSLRVGDRLGGHWLLGHVDGQGTILRRQRSGRFLTLEIRVPSHLADLLVPKGPIAVDGVSLTLDPSPFPPSTSPSPPKGEKEGMRGEGGVRGGIKVHLIPHTAKVTTLGKKRLGNPVNLEIDLVAKYLRGML